MSHANTSGPAPRDNVNNSKTVAIIISVLALLLAIAEMASKSAQTDANGHNIEAANLWTFFQAKTIRRTTIETAAEAMQLEAEFAHDPAVKDKLEKQVAEWRKEAQRYRSEPQTNEGIQELAKRAEEAGIKRMTAMARYHHYEAASATFQIAIVLSAASIITGVVYLLWAAGALGAIGIVLTGLGALAPQVLYPF